MVHEPCHVVDVLPTILAATGSSYLPELGGHKIQPLQGEPFLDLLEGKEWTRAQPIFFEHEGNCAVRHGRFKLVRQYGQDWELYDVDADRTELNDLVGGKFLRLWADLTAQYEDWAEKTGVLTSSGNNPQTALCGPAEIRPNLAFSKAELYSAPKIRITASKYRNINAVMMPARPA